MAAAMAGGAGERQRTEEGAEKKGTAENMGGSVPALSSRMAYGQGGSNTYTQNLQVGSVAGKRRSGHC